MEDYALDTCKNLFQYSFVCSFYTLLIHSSKCSNIQNIVQNDRYRYNRQCQFHLDFFFFPPSSSGFCCCFNSSAFRFHSGVGSENSSSEAADSLAAWKVIRYCAENACFNAETRSVPPDADFTKLSASLIVPGPLLLDADGGGAVEAPKGFHACLLQKTIRSEPSRGLRVAVEEKSN